MNPNSLSASEIIKNIKKFDGVGRVFIIDYIVPNYNSDIKMKITIECNRNDEIVDFLKNHIIAFYGFIVIFNNETLTF